jgi:glycosyltransferase involved in cell wall biosynthesis
VVGGIAGSLLIFRGEMLRSMSSHGHQVLALAPEDDEHVRATLRSMGVAYATVPIHRTGTSPFRDIATLISLTRKFRSFRPDAVLTYTAKPVIYGSVAAWLAGVPVRAAMITGVGSGFGGGSGLRRRTLFTVLRGLYRIGLGRAHIVFFQNPDDSQLFRTMGLVSDRHLVIRINGSGVDLEEFSPAAFPPPPITFLMIARLLREKGVWEYAEAARRVRDVHPEVRFQLLGPLDSNPSAITPRELAELREDGAVDYLGSTSDVRPFLSNAHVCVLPSYYGEGVPHTLLEAMAMGRALLTTDAPGCRETVVVGRNGLLVPQRDAAALAGGMLRMLAEPARLESMGRQSRLIAEERFDVHAVNRIILAAMGLDAPGSHQRS